MPTFEKQILENEPQNNAKNSEENQPQNNQQNPQNNLGFNKDGTPKKDGRGRKRKDPNQPQQKPQEKPAAKQGSLDDVLGKYAEQNAAPTENTNPAQTQPINQESLQIDGLMFLGVIDTIFPMAGLYLYGFVDKEVRLLNIKPDSVSLSKDQMAKLEPLADAAARELFKDVSPVGMFLIGISGAYMFNIKHVVTTEKEKQKEKLEKAKLEDKKLFKKNEPKKTEKTNK